MTLEARWDPRDGYRVSDWEQRTGTARAGSQVWRWPQLGVRDCDDPRPAADQVLLEVLACGICGSDLHFYETDDDGYMLYPGLTRFPTITGHELCGRVVEVGTDVTDLERDDLVTVEEIVWCGQCDACRRGFFNHCTQLEELGFTIPGAFAERIAVGAKYCWKLDAVVERHGEARAIELGALSEPTAVSYHALFNRPSGFQPGAYVAVFGAGPIGLTAIGLAVAAGAGQVVAFETSTERRQLASQLGATSVWDPAQSSPAEIMAELSKGEGFDLHVEAAGAPQITVPQMAQALAVDARVVIIGRAAQVAPMYLETFQVRRAQLYGSQGHAGHGNFPGVIRLVASGRLDLSAMISVRYPLEEAVAAVERGTARTDGKILITP
jgi:hypothetical protein